MSEAPLDTTARNEPFGYACSHCGGCCHYVVGVNAYEIARLARRLGKSTSAFEAENTVARHGQGRVLRQDPANGACQFWKGPGCDVYEDRPLACRIYPLGRDVTAEGVEAWRRVDPHPDSKADDTVTGVIGDYVGGDDNQRYMWAKDAYTGWMRWFYARMSGPNPPTPVDPGRFAAFLDLDTALAIHRAETGEGEPTDLVERARLHLDILYRQLPPEKTTA